MVLEVESPRFPQRYAAASLKHGRRIGTKPQHIRFPQRYAAASLKPHQRADDLREMMSFPQRYAAASLKQDITVGTVTDIVVFRSVMLRPH